MQSKVQNAEQKQFDIISNKGCATKNEETKYSILKLFNLNNRYSSIENIKCLYNKVTVM